uniref:Retrovirus-related Pol polyprotein from transposon TNT 1-94 n=1 Tax=Tanacetum cinerariifolium TaxID=118510 RepID=A0A6L2L9P2_TANCI|nr:retrovirus-related Pol polyprotein from transposon TNT 1-94 [Tanacetum cinerariifolium]
MEKPLFALNGYLRKKDETDIVIKNKARLVAQGYNQQKGIDYDETVGLVARIKAIRIFLTFATYMNFTVYQMDVKSAFLIRKLKEEVYVKQPSGFESSEFPNICKLDKALWTYTSSKSMIKQFKRGILINQEKYVKDLLKKYEINGSAVKNPMVPLNSLGLDLNGKSVNETQYRGYGEAIEAKGTLKKSLLPPRWRLLMAQIIQCLRGETGGFEDIINKLNKKTKEKVGLYPRFLSLLLAYKMEGYGNDNVTLNPTVDEPVVLKAPKTSLKDEKKVPQCKKIRAISARRKQIPVLYNHPQSKIEAVKCVSSSKKDTGQAASVASTDEADPVETDPNDSVSLQQASTDEADPVKTDPNDSVSLQQGIVKGTNTISFDHIFAGTNLSVLNVKVGFMDLDSPKDDEPIIIQDEEEDNVEKVQPEVPKETEDALAFHPLSLSNSLPTELKELPSKFNDLTRPRSRPWMLFQVFSTRLLKPWTDQAGTHPTEGEKNTTQVTITRLFQRIIAKVAKRANLNSQSTTTPPPTTTTIEVGLIKKDKGNKAMSSKYAEEEDNRSDFNEHANLTGSMVESSKKKKLKIFDFVIKEAELEIHFYKPLSEQDHILKLNDLGRKKRKNADDIHDYFRSTKRYKSSVQYEDHPFRTVLNEPILEMTLRDFLHFPGNCLATFLVRPVDAPISVGSHAILVIDLFDETLRAAAAKLVIMNVLDDEDTLLRTSQKSIATRVIQRKATTPSTYSASKGKRITTPSYADFSSFKKIKHMVLDEGPSSTKFVSDFTPSSDEVCRALFGSLVSTKEARFFHAAFFNLLYPDVQRNLDGLTLTKLANFHEVTAVRFVMSNNMLNREALALFVEIFKLCGEVVILKNQQFKSAHVVSKLKADTERFEEKEVVFLATDASMQLKIKALKDILDLVDQERSLKSHACGESQALREVADLGSSLELKSMKDYDLIIEKVYDRAVDTFYLVKFSYVDLLVHFSDQCLGKLITLKPPIMHSGNTSGAGPFVNPFL